jgi:hypothetical protein
MNVAKKIIKKLPVVLLALASLSACKNLTAASGGEILYIDSKIVDCVGVAPRKCLLTRTDENADWLFFYDQIEGFEYEAGYRYKLRIVITPVDNPPADASSLHYKLIEVLEKSPAPAN